MVLKRGALEHNLAVLARFCRQRELKFAPHGKTTMSPALWRAQLAAGAWAITVATPNQALICAKAGVPRVVLANQVLDQGPLAWLADNCPEFYFFVDSVAGVRVAAATGRQLLFRRGRRCAGGPVAAVGE